MQISEHLADHFLSLERALLLSHMEVRAIHRWNKSNTYTWEKMLHYYTITK